MVAELGVVDKVIMADMRARHHVRARRNMGAGKLRKVTMYSFRLGPSAKNTLTHSSKLFRLGKVRKTR